MNNKSLLISQIQPIQRAQQNQEYISRGILYVFEAELLLKTITTNWIIVQDFQQIVFSQATIPIQN